MIKSSLGVALVGTGGVAHMHAQGFAQHRNVSLVGAYSRSDEKRMGFAATYGMTPYDSIDALLADDKVDAVAILTPTPTHVDYALAAMEAGKHVLIEKPVARDTTELQKLIDAAAKADVVCMPNHNYIYSPEVQRARGYIEEGAFGKLSSLWMIYNQKHWPDELPILTCHLYCIPTHKTLTSIPYGFGEATQGVFWRLMMKIVLITD